MDVSYVIDNMEATGIEFWAGDKIKLKRLKKVHFSGFYKSVKFTSLRF
jgi:hypothetical protein